MSKTTRIIIPLVAFLMAVSLVAQTTPRPPIPTRNPPPTPRLVDMNATMPSTGRLAAGPGAGAPTFFLTGSPGLFLRASAAETYATSSSPVGGAVRTIAGSWTVRLVVIDGGRETVASYLFDGTFNDGAVRPGVSGAPDTFAFYGATTYSGSSGFMGHQGTGPQLYVRMTGTCGSHTTVHWDAWLNSPAPHNASAAAARSRDLYAQGDFIGDVACSTNVAAVRSTLNAH